MRQGQGQGRVYPEIHHEICLLCGDCVTRCPYGALTIKQDRIALNKELCSYCGDCEDVCPVNAIALPYQVVLGSDAAPPSASCEETTHG